MDREGFYEASVAKAALVFPDDKSGTARCSTEAGFCYAFSRQSGESSITLKSATL
jgi:hypothetical protein